jgi:hypothetical protein
MQIIVSTPCLASETTWSDGINPDKTVNIGDPTSNAYTFTPPTPTTTNPACTIVTHSIINKINTKLTPSNINI